MVLKVPNRVSFLPLLALCSRYVLTRAPKLYQQYLSIKYFHSQMIGLNESRHKTALVAKNI